MEILEFFDNCELHGRNIPTVVDPFAPNANQSPTGHQGFGIDDTVATISSEARMMKSLFIRLYE